MPDPDLRTMATVLAALGDGITDDIACIEALQWARYSDRDIRQYFGVARAIARNLRYMERKRQERRQRTQSHAR